MKLVQIEDEQQEEFTDGLKKATDENVGVNTSEDQVDMLKELKENVKLLNGMKTKKKKLSLCSWCFYLILILFTF